MKEQRIWTIGHSTRTIDDFTALLQPFEIEMVADVRRFPASRRYPHFSRDNLKASLLEHNIGYIHFPELGGRRKPNPASRNTRWRLAAFRGYADYMESDEFQEGIQKLNDIAVSKRTAYMCSEAVWWSCHRALISDFLKSTGWNIIHIMGADKAQEHPYTSPATIVSGRLSYGP